MRKIFILFALIIIWSFVSISRNGLIPILTNIDFVEILFSLFIEVIGICYLIKNSIFTSRIKVVSLFCLYVCIVVLLTSNNIIMDLRCVLWWPIIYMVSYVISYRRYVKFEDNNFKYSFILLFCIAIVLFVYAKMINPLSYTIQGQEFFIRKGNQIFYIVTLLPIAFMQKQIVRYIILLLGLLAAIYSFKRSAILISVFLMILSLWFDLKAQNERFSRYLMLFIFLLLSCFVIQNIDSGINEYLLERFDNMGEGGGSGRTQIYNKLICDYFNQNFILMLFGSGYNSVMRFQNIRINSDSLSAHNDYLEYLYDFGFIGLFFYLWFTYALMKCIYRCKNKSIRYFTISVFLTFLFLGLVSHLALYPTYICYLMIMIGMIEGYVDCRIKRRWNKWTENRTFHAIINNKC